MDTENMNLSKQIISTPSVFKKDEEFTDDRFMRVRIALMHSGINRNNSRFTKEVIEAAADSFVNIPVLADVREYKDTNGNKVLDYYGHSMHIEEDAFNEGENRMIYDERIVGIIPQTNNFEIKYNKKDDNYFAYADALLYREYGNYVCDILESRDSTTEVSMEIYCNNISYSAEDKCLDVGEMTACGVTLLGADVAPGMKGAHATVFSMNAEDKQSQLIQIMQELKESLDNYTKVKSLENLKRGGSNNLNKFEELLNKYNKTAEDIDFEYEDLTDEELQEKFAEVFDDKEPEEDTEAKDDKSEDEPEEDEMGEGSENEPEDGTEVKENETCGGSVSDKKKKRKFTVENDGIVKDFEISLNDKVEALWSLVNTAYSEEDNAYYSVEVFEDYVIMKDGWNNKFFKQSYLEEDGNFSLTGERIVLFEMYVTEEEKNELEEMRSNYSFIQEQLSAYQTAEINAAKQEILNDGAYADFADSEDFKTLAEQASQYSIEELRDKADITFAKLVKAKGIFSAKEKEEYKSIQFDLNKPVEKKPYGKLFD